MPRLARLVCDDQPTVYHVMSRTALDGFPLGNAEKEFLLQCITRFAAVYFAEVLGFCIMGNHFHLLVRMMPAEMMTDDDVVQRYHLVYGPDAPVTAASLERCRRKWASLSEFMREVKQTFSRYYNKRHDRRGYFWGERFKSVVVQDGRTLVHCLAYIDLNPIRAGLVQRPEDYRWSSIGHHAQTGNVDGLLSLDFGLADWDIEDINERLVLYRRFLYETGALDSVHGKSLASHIVERARSEGYVYTRVDRMLLRTRWFTDSGVIGSKEFVTALLGRVSHTKGRKRFPRKIDGLEFYAMKRLVEEF
ncbi:transposase [Desulfovibrio inopinatus]|uniref:transposase n=1 Tax=Desulfovibrio inopinatus TaxID=102109 RepID=UPI0004143DC5|nr:transposase [Desulfovibrio inopinatus]